MHASFILSSSKLGAKRKRLKGLCINSEVLIFYPHNEKKWTCIVIHIIKVINN